jgi:hypothetical protein
MKIRSLTFSPPRRLSAVSQSCGIKGHPSPRASTPWELNSNPVVLGLCSWLSSRLVRFAIGGRSERPEVLDAAGGCQPQRQYLAPTEL